MDVLVAWIPLSPSITETDMIEICFVWKDVNRDFK